MQMEMLENGCLKIMLSEEDLVILGLNFASMEEDNDATRDAIQMLLLAAREETGFAPENGVTVEALPVDGGCLLLFTPSAGHRRVRMKRASGPYIYELEDAEQLFPACGRAVPSRRSTETSAAAHGGQLALPI